jgi:hypothetical protein
MKRKIYVETSVISYLTARPSKTIIGAAHQQITLAWWELRSDHELLVSQSVWQECAAGDPEIQEKIAAYLEQRGLFLPIICTPEELLGGNSDD